MATLALPACHSHGCHGPPSMRNWDDPSARRIPDMSSDAKSSIPTTTTPPPKHREQGIRIFMWPKVIFLYPTAIVALICAIGMHFIGDRVWDPSRRPSEAHDPRQLAGTDSA